MERIVLVVEDQPDFLCYLLDRLEGFGFNVLGAASGAEALRLAAGHSLLAVVSDICMPGFSGFELLAALTAKDTGLPVFLMSADYTVSEATVRALGGHGFFHKPFPVEALAERLASCVLEPPVRVAKAHQLGAGGEAQLLE